MIDATRAGPGGSPQWAVRRAAWFLVIVHLPIAAFPALTTITRRPGMPASEMALIAVAAAALGGLQLRHSLAASRGNRPRGWPLTFAALAVLADAPFLFRGWYTYDWVNEAQWFVMASAIMLLPRRAAVGAAVAAIATATIPYCVHDFAVLDFGLPQTILFGCLYVVIVVMGGMALYGSARLVAILDDLFAARTELAQQALAHERVRMSRDLHDLLGQRLSAVSLKGDLAIRLLSADPPAAQREIESLAALTRSALRDMRAVTWADHDVSLATEADTARAILQAAGTDVRVSIALPPLAQGADAVLGWAVREGTTNILRHAQPTSVTIEASSQDGSIRLEIVNDGAGPAAGEGSGLAGLASRARAAGGAAAGAYLDCGKFRLLVEIPKGAP